MGPWYERKPRSKGELPPAQLESLHRRLAAVVIKRGSRIHYEGMYALESATEMPFAKRMLINPAVAKVIFYENDDLLIPKKPGVVEYLSPHHVNPLSEAPNDPVYEFLSIQLDWKIGDSEMEQHEMYWLHSTDGEMSGAVSTDLYRSGKRISPNDVRRTRHETNEELCEHIRDLNALEHPLAAQDAAKIRLLTKVLR